MFDRFLLGCKVCKCTLRHGHLLPGNKKPNFILYSEPKRVILNNNIKKLKLILSFNTGLFVSLIIVLMNIAFNNTFIAQHN